MHAAPPAKTPRRFEFARDAFAFPNELLCEYVFPADGGRPRMVAKEPRPDFALRCFPLLRSARQFFHHAEFRPQDPPLAGAEYERRVRAVFRRNPRAPCPAGRRVPFPGYDSLRSFSQDWEKLLKAECGGPWRSYVLRSHWRMVFPISRRHQARTAGQLAQHLAEGRPPIVHVVRFPQLTINHALLLFGLAAGPGEQRFAAYDPNDAGQPAVLTFNEATRTFSLPANRYWPGGRLDVIEIYRSWWF
jgi:hypothetical protein